VLIIFGINEKSKSVEVSISSDCEFLKTGRQTCKILGLQKRVKRELLWTNGKIYNVEQLHWSLF